MRDRVGQQVKAGQPIMKIDESAALNGIFWVLRSGAPWRDLREAFGSYTTCYNQFVRWRRAGVWGRIIDALAAAHDGAVQMIDASIVSACISMEPASHETCASRWGGRAAA